MAMRVVACYSEVRILCMTAQQLDRLNRWLITTYSLFIFSERSPFPYNLIYIESCLIFTFYYSNDKKASLVII